MTFPKVHRVLYAESDSDCRFLICFLGELAGIEITAVKTASEMWQFAQTEYFDLYMMSSRFSDGDGFQLCRRLKAYAPDTPILFYSGNAYATDMEKGLAAGASAYLIKPYSENLMAIVRQYIEIPMQTNETEFSQETEKPERLAQIVEISLLEYMNN